jgi:hypothetical protein
MNMKNTDDIQVKYTGGMSIEIQQSGDNHMSDLFIVDIGPTCMRMNDGFHKSIDEQDGN